MSVNSTLFYGSEKCSGWWFCAQWNVIVNERCEIKRNVRAAL